MSQKRLVSKKDLKLVLGIPYSPQHIARLEKAGRAVPTYYARAEHTALGTDTTVASAVVEILDSGATTLLATAATVPR